MRRCPTRRADPGEKRDVDLSTASLKVRLFVEPDLPMVTLHRHQPEGGFAVESHSGLDAGETSLLLAALYGRVELKA